MKWLKEYRLTLEEVLLGFSMLAWAWVFRYRVWTMVLGALAGLCWLIMAVLRGVLIYRDKNGL